MPKSNIKDLITHLPEKDSKLFRALRVLIENFNTLFESFTEYLRTPLNYPIVFNLPGVPAQDETSCLILVPKGVTLTIGANFEGSWITIGTSATAETVYTFYRARPDVANEEIGTLTIQSDNSFRFDSKNGRLITFNYKDALLVTTPNPQDATLADVNLTILGKINRV